MSRKSSKRGMERREAAAEVRAAIAKQYNIPDSAMVTSAPLKLGRALFLSKKDMMQHVGATKYAPEKRADFNAKKVKGT